MQKKKKKINKNAKIDIVNVSPGFAPFTLWFSSTTDFYANTLPSEEIYKDTFLLNHRWSDTKSLKVANINKLHRTTNSSFLYAYRSLILDGVY